MGQCTNVLAVIHPDSLCNDTSTFYESLQTWESHNLCFWNQRGQSWRKPEKEKKLKTINISAKKKIMKVKDSVWIIIWKLKPCHFYVQIISICMIVSSERNNCFHRSLYDFSLLYIWLWREYFSYSCLEASWVGWYGALAVATARTAWKFTSYWGNKRNSGVF